MNEKEVAELRRRLRPDKSNICLLYTSTVQMSIIYLLYISERRFSMNIYSTFYRPNKPQGIEQRKAHIVGGGIAGLAAAVFLIDDAGMPGKNITIYEKRRDMGGCCGIIGAEGAYVCPGEREVEPLSLIHICLIYLPAWRSWPSTSLI